jgi:hypothetical protein
MIDSTSPSGHEPDGRESYEPPTLTVHELLVDITACAGSGKPCDKSIEKNCKDKEKEIEKSLLEKRHWF